MTAPDRNDLRQRIDMLEALYDLQSAISDIGDAEMEPGETTTVAMAARGGLKEMPLATAHGLPQDIVMHGLRSMRDELARQLQAMHAIPVAA